MWCRKHLQVALVSNEQTLEEEHSVALFQVCSNNMEDIII